MALADLDGANAFLQQLRKRGHKVCLDDFGTGASAFEYLRTLDVDIVKIDGSYIRNASKTPKGADFVRAITALCSSLGVETVAEMVETEEVVKPLIDWGIVYGQGYLFGKPNADIESFEGGRTGQIINLKRKGVVESWQ
jgi:EAL domain-containing protein (putative c-di-GMP-specific phosphodiesterase class I)